MKKIILIAMIAFSICSKLENIPVTLQQPDGNMINCYVSGDEYYSRLHDGNDYTIVQSNNGYYYYAKYENNNIMPSIHRVNSINPKDINIPKNIKISKQDYLNIRSEYWEDVETRDAPSIGTINNLNVFIRFADENEFVDPRSYHDELFNNSDGPSMYHYFKEVSYDLLTVNTIHYPQCDFTTNLSYQDSYTRDYYKPYNETSNPIGYQNDNQARVREHTLLQNAIEFIADEVPESLDIDANDDGYVDNVTFLVSGSPGAWAELLWPHRWALYTFDVFINGSRVYDYNLNLDQGGYFTVGTLCHEFFHSLGAPDLYHYYDDVAPVAVGSWDVMDASSDIPQSMGAYMKYKYTDWITELPVIDYGGTYEISPLSSSENNIYRINSPSSSTEHFVVEYRVKEGLYEINTPGDQNGLLIYRVNTLYNGNANGPPDELYLYRAGGTLTSSGSFGAAIFNQEVERTEFNDMTDPSSFLSDDSNGGINISYVGEPLDLLEFTVTNLVLVSELSTVSYDTDNDGNINPGEEIIIDFTVSNFSEDIIANNIVGTLSVDNDYINIINDTVDFSNVLFPEDNSNGSFVINISPDIDLGDIDIFLDVSASYVENGSTQTYTNSSVYNVNVNLNQSTFPYFTSSQVSTAPIITDFDNNGENEIIFADFNGIVYALDGNKNETIADIFPFETNGQIWGSPALADINNDGNDELIISSQDKHIYVLNNEGLLFEYDAQSQLIGSPSIGNFDSDSNLEIAIGGYSSSGKKLYVIDDNGESLNGYPLDIDEKIQKGISLYDFNQNGKDDMVFGTDDNHIYLIYDNGEIAEGFPFIGDDKFRIAPIIINYNNSLLIVSATIDGTVYGIDSMANLVFEVETGHKITTVPTFHIVNNLPYIMLGNQNGDLYALDLLGNIYNDFPMNFDNEIIGSIISADLNEDLIIDFIFSDDGGNLYIMNLDGTFYDSSPMEYDFSYFSSPSINDVDFDGDLELCIGTTNSLNVIDLKQQVGSFSNHYSIFRSNLYRNGYYSYFQCGTGDLNNDYLINIMDIILIINIIIDSSDIPQEDMCNADINSDSMINVQDIISLINLILP